MRCLWPLGQYGSRVTAMNKYNTTSTATIQALPTVVVDEPLTTAIGAGALEVNVIFTDSKETAAALKVANGLAQDLGACVHLWAALPVPIRLGLDQCPVSIPFMENRLRELIANPALNGTEHIVHLFVCRDSTEAVLGALKPKSLVVVGGRRHWWPNRVSRLEAALRSKGHRVVFVNTNKRLFGSGR
jgi:hypothetical protein